MATLLLVRHGVTSETGTRLYGRSSGVHLSDEGRRQAEALAERLGDLSLAAVYTSPLDRCLETAGPLAQRLGLEVETLEGLLEVDYGRWTGRTFAALRRTRTWRLIRSRPSAAGFPDGESLAEAQRRSVATLEEVAARHPRRAVALVTHGDVIRLSVAHFAGIHLDLFQRLEVPPGSVSAVRLDGRSVRIPLVGDTGALDDLVPRRRRSRGVGG